ncbi:MAG: hypothetical protein WBM90_10205 [Acidimicrobiia bacterium]
MKGKFRLGFRLGALLRHPFLLLEAIRTGIEMRRHGAPLPSSAYLNWRLQTAYGSANTAPPTTDLVHYLRWRQQMRRIRAWERSA